ncbi:MAG TPA: protein kinase [Kofleriaceae bacterium]
MADQGSQGPTVDRPTQDERSDALGALHRGPRYEMRGLIAKGGMGEVHAAIDQQINREVAIKRMKESAPSEHAMTRFFREATIQGRLDHPAIVPVHELGVDEGGRPYFVMKKLAGTTLADRISREHPREALLRAFVDVCLAVEFAHSRGIVHRDLKPANIVLGDYGEVYVLDWGVAKILGSTGDSEIAGESGPGETGAGAVIGTIGYMAPEQVGSAAHVDARADVFALGCILFEILAGEPLYKRGTQDAKVDARPSSRGRDVPPELDMLTVVATAASIDERLASARLLGERVQRFLDGDRDLAQRRELARTQLGFAQAAFAKPDEASRRSAIRHAGRAVALDPQLPGAAELVTRLMLEPPATTPPEVTVAIQRDDLQSLERIGSIGSWAYLGFLAFVPLVFNGAPIVLTVGLIAAIAVTIALLRLWRPFGPSRLVWVAFSNAFLIAMLARMFSPFLIAPGIAAITVMIMMFSPTFARLPAMLGLLAVMAAAIFVPYWLERYDVLSRTMIEGPTYVTFTGSGHTELGNESAAIAFALYALALLAVAAFMGQALRRAEREMRQHLHLQAWQLRHLVPDAA